MKLALALIASLPLVACGDGGKSDSDYNTDVTTGMHDSIGTHLGELAAAAQELMDAAPTHAWDATADATAITAMEAAWRKTRVAYELVEGATAPIFPQYDVTMDERYDGFLANELNNMADPDLFDDQGVTGMHAIERILYAPTTREEVIMFESMLPGYTAAAWPTTDAQAMEFKTLLCQKLIDDANALHDQWVPSVIDTEAAFQGLVGLMNEQKEKVNLAASGEEESRYANVTLFDLHNNLSGTKEIYGLFQSWVTSKDGGEDIDTMIEDRFDDLNTAYSSVSGDALPDVPADWSSDAPTPANLATPFGMMWQEVHNDVDPTMSGSAVYEMNAAAVLLGFQPFSE
ncbi:MAG TPA: imelysin family protein [Kofleriaceae bacterium]